MSKQEFIDKLRLALSGRVSANLVEENVAYYEEYINTQIRLGQAEGMVLTSLGDPRLIAKTIIAANGGAGDSMTDDTREYSGNGDDKYHTEVRESAYPKVVSVPGWVWILVVVLILILVLSVVFSVISFLLPFVPLILVIYFFVKLFRDWLK